MKTRVLIAGLAIMGLLSACSDRGPSNEVAISSLKRAYDVCAPDIYKALAELDFDRKTSEYLKFGGDNALIVATPFDAYESEATLSVLALACVVKVLDVPAAIRAKIDHAMQDAGSYVAEWDGIKIDLDVGSDSLSAVFTSAS